MQMELDNTWFMMLENASEKIDTLMSKTGCHSRRVAEMAHAIANQLGMQPEDLGHMWWGAILHDVGKIGIPSEILQKNGPLDEREWQLMELHPMIGSNLVEFGLPDSPVAAIVRAHQEKYNGRGYPDGLSGEQIPLGARVLAVVDAYDAMTNDRPYRKACGSEEAVQEICDLSGEQFDPQVVDVFVKMVSANGHHAG